MAAGLVLILVLDVATALRAFAGLIWIVAGHYELRRLQAGFDDLGAIRLHSDGSVEFLNHDHQWLARRVRVRVYSAVEDRLAAPASGKWCAVYGTAAR